MQLGVPRSSPQTWLDELQAVLQRPDRGWNPDSTVDLLTAGSEFAGWLYDRRHYEKRHEQGWLSAIADFSHSARLIG